MRFRASAAIGLVLALLAAPASALACTFQCAAPSAPQAVVPPVSEDCHGAAANDRSADIVVTGAHDCAQHAQLPAPALRAEASRTGPLAIAAVPAGTSGLTPVNAGGSNRAHVSAHDLAPPGAATRFIDALRI